MANNYLQFSFDVPMDKDEWNWCLERLELLGEAPEDWKEDPDDAGHNALMREMNEWALVKNLRDERAFFSVQTDQYDGGILFYAEESGVPDEAALFVQEFLKRWRPNGSIGFEWSFSCSKARPGEFGGGACFVTADELKFHSTSAWLSAHDAMHTAKQREVMT